MEIFEITRSRLRKELLGFYFLHPGGRYYLRELEKILKMPVANIRRELLKLSKSGLFMCEKIGNLSYYSINKRSPIYGELRNIILKTVGLADIFKRNLNGIKGIDFAFIYGSFANGREIMSSDIDLMMIGKCVQDDILPAVRRIEKETGRLVNHLSFTAREFMARQRKKNSFIMNVMRQKKIMVIGEESELQRLGR